MISFIHSLTFVSNYKLQHPHPSPATLPYHRMTNVTPSVVTDPLRLLLDDLTAVSIAKIII